MRGGVEGVGGGDGIVQAKSLCLGLIHVKIIFTKRKKLIKGENTAQWNIDCPSWGSISDYFFNSCL